VWPQCAPRCDSIRPRGGVAPIAKSHDFSSSGRWGLGREFGPGRPTRGRPPARHRTPELRSAAALPRHPSPPSYEGYIRAAEGSPLSYSSLRCAVGWPTIPVAPSWREVAGPAVATLRLAPRHHRRTRRHNSKAMLRWRHREGVKHSVRTAWRRPAPSGRRPLPALPVPSPEETPASDGAHRSRAGRVDFLLAPNATVVV